MDNFDFDNLLNGFSEMLKEFDKALDKCMEQGFSDSVSTPIGQFYIETAPFPDFMSNIEPHKWVTVVGVEKNNKAYGPSGVEFYDDRESAMKGHDEWRHLIIDTPPCVLKDVNTGKLTYIPA